MFPVKVEVALPVTSRFVVVTEPLKNPVPMTSSCAKVVVLDPPMSTWFVVVVRRIPELLKVFHSCPAAPPAPASAPQVNFPVEALYSKVADSLEQSASPS
jgi:hypothetical protein